MYAVESYLSADKQRTLYQAVSLAPHFVLSTGHLTADNAFAALAEINGTPAPVQVTQEFGFCSADGTIQIIFSSRELAMQWAEQQQLTHGKAAGQLVEIVKSVRNVPMSEKIKATPVAIWADGAWCSLHEAHDFEEICGGRSDDFRVVSVTEWEPDGSPAAHYFLEGER